MILITEIVVARPFPLILDCRLYHMAVGDTLSVAQQARCSATDITPAFAKELLWSRCCVLPDGALGCAEAEEAE